QARLGRSAGTPQRIGSAQKNAHTIRTIGFNHRSLGWHRYRNEDRPMTTPDGDVALDVHKDAPVTAEAKGDRPGNRRVSFYAGRSRAACYAFSFAATAAV